VNTKDFAAIGTNEETGSIWWSTDKLYSKSTPLSLPGKIEEAMKGGIRRIVPKLALFRVGGNVLHGRRGSAQAGGVLEYPELEILPTKEGYWELRALEMELEQIRALSCS